jgi:hypothetical protein
MKSVFLLLLIVCSYQTFGQSRFYRQYWIEYDGSINNNKQQGERTRVNDRGISTLKTWYTRFESQVNGLALLTINDTILHIERAEMVFEMWGGHPKTDNKRFSINGRQYYSLPSEQTKEGHYEYRYPIIPVDFRDFVYGTNAIQFLCDRGETFWGHFILEEIGVNVFLKTGTPEIVQSGLDRFSAMPEVKSKVLADNVAITLNMPSQFIPEIEAVHYFAHYLGFDASGSGTDVQWHGYLKGRHYEGHLGTANQAPFKVNWNTRMIPDQGTPMAIKAIVHFKNGLMYETEVLRGLTFPLTRPHVQLYHCTELPKPFWSRNNQVRKANIELPSDLSKAERVELHVRNWDGGEGTIREPFKLNGVPYRITQGNAPHKLIYTINPVELKNLQPGANNIELLSDTEHHGIELCLPGPCLVVRYSL